MFNLSHQAKTFARLGHAVHLIFLLDILIASCAVTPDTRSADMPSSSPKAAMTSSNITSAEMSDIAAAESPSDNLTDLLTDPSIPGTGTTNTVEVEKPPSLVTSALLTAPTHFPASKYPDSRPGSIQKNQESEHHNSSESTIPVLSGSLIIALPTRTATSPIPASTPLLDNGLTSASLYTASAPQSTIYAFVTVDSNQTASPTTSTAVVYATNAPVVVSSSASPAIRHTVSAGQPLHQQTNPHFYAAILLTIFFL